MRYEALRRWLPRFLHDRILHFEAATERALCEFAGSLTSAERVLDAGAGEGRHARFFPLQRYCAVDLGVGDAAWDYGRLDVRADLMSLPFRAASFDACVHIVTLEHLAEPGRALRELARTLKPGGRLLLVAPLEWEVHQAPHDYFRFTRHGLQYLLAEAGFTGISIAPVGGYFRLLSRRLFNGLQFFSGCWFLLAVLLLAWPALLLPWLDSLDRRRDFTLGYICTARLSF